MGDGVARRIEPAAASRRMKPALAMLTLRIFAVEQIIGPFGLRHPVVRPRPLDMALASPAEFHSRAPAATGPVDTQHLYISPRARCTTHRTRRSPPPSPNIKA